MPIFFIPETLRHHGHTGMSVPPNPNRKEMRLQQESITSDHQDCGLIVIFMHAGVLHRSPQWEMMGFDERKCSLSADVVIFFGGGNQCKIAFKVFHTGGEEC